MVGCVDGGNLVIKRSLVSLTTSSAHHAHTPVYACMLMRRLRRTAPRSSASCHQAHASSGAAAQLLRLCRPPWQPPRPRCAGARRHHMVEDKKRLCLEVGSSTRCAAWPACMVCVSHRAGLHVAWLGRWFGLGWFAQDAAPVCIWPG